jgi:hypothetical protein
MSNSDLISIRKEYGRLGVLWHGSAVLLEGGCFEDCLRVSRSFLSASQSISGLLDGADPIKRSIEILSTNQSLLETACASPDRVPSDIEPQIKNHLLELKKIQDLIGEAVSAQFPRFKIDFRKIIFLMKRALNPRVIGAAIIIAGVLYGARRVYVHTYSLNGEYFPNTALKNVFATRLDSGIDFNWGYSSPLWNFKSDEFSVRWTGFLQVPRDGEYEFTTVSDDGVRLWVNDTLIIDDWRGHFPESHSGKLQLAKGLVPIRLEYFDAGLTAMIRLMWKPEYSGKETVIPARYLRPRKKESPAP